MKAVIFRGQGQVAVEERPRPELQAATDVIVRVAMTTVCGTDIRLLAGRLPAMPGTAIGHEFAGVIEEVGPEVSAFKPGERVVSPFSAFCGGCFYCKKGILTACERRQVFGFGQLGGAQAEYVRVPFADALLERLPEAVTDTQAAFLSDVLPGTYAGWSLADLHAGDSVAVVGCGPTGLCAVLLARAMGAGAVFAVDHHPDRLAMAERLGATPLNADGEDVPGKVRAATAGRGADIAAEATGTLGGLNAAAALARPWGAVLNLGLGIERGGDFPIASLAARHVRFIPASVPPVKNYIAPLIRMLTAGVIDPSPIASHTLPLADAPSGYELMANRREGALKVLLRP